MRNDFFNTEARTFFQHRGTKTQRMNREEINKLSGIILDSAIVHTQLGPGLLESIYEVCLCRELNSGGINFKKQLIIPIHYKGELVEGGLKLDILVEDEIIVELESVDIMHPVYSSQLLTYLRLTNKKLGLLINFNVPKLKDGFERIIMC